MIVFVKYYRDAVSGYCGRTYTYKTEMPLKVGDKVIAPTRNEPRQRAMVTAINLHESVISPKWEKDVKYITEYYVEEEQA